MFGFLKVGEVHQGHTLALLLGYFSLLHPLVTIFVWAATLAYCASLLSKQFEIRHITDYILPHYYTFFFLSLCTIISILKLRSTHLYENAKQFRLGANFRPRHFYRLLFCCAISSVIVAAAWNGELTQQEFMGIGIGLVLFDWRFIPSLIKVSYFYHFK